MNGFIKKSRGSELKPVLETLIYLKHETDIWFEITTLVIPGENDSEKEISEMTEWIVENLGCHVPLHFSAFHPDWKMLNHAPTPISTLKLARQIAINNGMNYVYTGNVHDEEGDTTFCTECSAALIIRDWYTLKTWDLDTKGQCKSCGTACHGIFEDSPGDWGAKRLPVRITS